MKRRKYLIIASCIGMLIVSINTINIDRIYRYNESYIQVGMIEYKNRTYIFENEIEIPKCILDSVQIYFDINMTIDNKNKQFTTQKYIFGKLNRDLINDKKCKNEIYDKYLVENKSYESILK